MMRAASGLRYQPVARTRAIPDKLKVLSLLGSPGSTVDIYRCVMPLSHMRLDGHKCFWITFEQLRELAEEGEMKAAYGHNVVILNRPISYPEHEMDLGTWVQAMKLGGTKLVYEVDDDYTGQYRSGDSDRTCYPWLRFADAITVSTYPLKRLMEEASEGRKPVYVLPNRINVDLFASRAEGSVSAAETVNVIVAGSETHYNDWRPLEGAMRAVKAAHPQVRFLVGGFLPFYLESVADEWLEPVGYAKYPEMLAQADILCAPLDPGDRFNDCKSAVKALEGWSTARQIGTRGKVGGCAVIASNVPAYRGTVQNRHNGLLVREHTPEAWAKAILRLVEDHKLRHRLQVEGLKDARELHDIRDHWKEWEVAYKSILGG